MRRCVAFLVCATVLAGCYRYVPVAGPAMAAGDEVRIQLTPEGVRRLEPTLGPQTTLVAGRIAPAGPAPAAPAGVAGTAPGDSALTLVVSSTTKAYGATTRWIGERVAVPVSAIAQGERRVLDRRRTALAAGGVVLGTAAGYAILRAIVGAIGGEDGSGGPPPVP